MVTLNMIQSFISNNIWQETQFRGLGRWNCLCLTNDIRDNEGLLQCQSLTFWTCCCPEQQRNEICGDVYREVSYIKNELQSSNVKGVGAGKTTEAAVRLWSCSHRSEFTGRLNVRYVLIKLRTNDGIFTSIVLDQSFLRLIDQEWLLPWYFFLKCTILLFRCSKTQKLQSILLKMK